MLFKRKKKRGLIELLMDRSIDYQMRSEAALEISTRKDARFFEPLVHALINDPEPSVRMNSAYALGELGMRGAKQSLHKALTSDGSEWVRGFCATALANLDVDHIDVEDTLIQLLETEIDSGAKRHYAHSLGIIGAKLDSKKSGTILVSALMTELDPGVRADAAEAIGEISYIDGLNAVSNAAKNDIDGEVRRQAMNTMRKLELI
jgi:HEAT repeat protein